MDKFLKFIIAVSLLTIAVNSMLISSYLKNIVELIGGISIP
ncbi:hypothetical protein [Sporosarcina saromensis]|uniref:Uncharacterized protein n=1 Tax=Sporosarcina saromensis TaxID=359365 RepID=A0ABU4GAF1_9BACL|nr:hypothetical protein [Sporosarcina saromensis]MDW0113928.1 hypothetical protein [Sporosarcina saromensis]